LVKIGLIYKQLTPADFRVLEAIEKYIGRYEYIPIEVIEKTARIPETKLVLILQKLRELKLVKRATVSGYKAFRLTYLGLDMLALRSLVKMNVLEAIDGRIGVGKESDIYHGKAPGDVDVIVKFLRIGRTSFRRTKVVRSWATDPKYTWFHQSKVAAEREYKALKELCGLGASVPRPFAYNRHVVVTEYINGVELYTRPELSDPMAVLKTILDTIRIAYLEAGIVHGDLSEYNILVDLENNKPYVIDWPQYVYRDEPSASDLLKRDVEYIVKFFNKVYGTGVDSARALGYVRGEYGGIE